MGLADALRPSDRWLTLDSRNGFVLSFWCCRGRRHTWNGTDAGGESANVSGEVIPPKRHTLNDNR